MTWEIVTKGLCDHYYQNNKMRKNINYNSGLIPYGSLRSWLELRNFLANGERLQKPEHCDQELWNLIMQVRFLVFLSTVIFTGVPICLE